MALGELGDLRRVDRWMQARRQEGDEPVLDAGVNDDPRDVFVLSRSVAALALRAFRDPVLIGTAGAEVAGLVISLDRQERGQGPYSAVQELRQALDIPVISIVQLDDLITLLEESSEYEEYLEPVLAYRKQYGVIS